MRHSHDAITHFDLPALERRAGLQLRDLAITILRREHCADAEEREIHPDGKILRLTRVEIIRVRIVHMRERREIHLQHIVLIKLRIEVADAVVAFGQLVHDFFRIGFLRSVFPGRLCVIRFRDAFLLRFRLCLIARVLFLGGVDGDFLAEIFAAQTLTPEMTRFFKIARRRLVLAVDDDLFIRVEHELLGLQQLVRVGDTFIHALTKPVEDFVGGTGVGLLASADGEIVQIGAVVCEPGQIFLREMQPLLVQCLNVAVKELLGIIIVEAMTAEMVHFQRGGRHVGDQRVVAAW